MDPEPAKKQENEDEQFMIQQQINLFSAPLPEICRGDSNIFFKEIYKGQGGNISSVQVGFQVAAISTEMYDFICVLINQIHCETQENLKLIIDGDDLWATSTIVYHQANLGDLRYNIIESNNRESLMKTREILRTILAECKQRYNGSQTDQQILKAIRPMLKRIQKAFKDPNADD